MFIFFMTVKISFFPLKIKGARCIKQIWFFPLVTNPGPSKPKLDFLFSHAHWSSLQYREHKFEPTNVPSYR